MNVDYINKQGNKTNIIPSGLHERKPAVFIAEASLSLRRAASLKDKRGDGTSASPDFLACLNKRTEAELQTVPEPE